MPDTPAALLVLLYAGVGTLFSLVAVWLINQTIALWEARQGGAPISESKRRWISIGVPAALVCVGYFGLVLIGTLALTWQTFWLACVSAFGAVGGKQFVYAGLASLSKPQTVNNITNIGTVESTRDVFLGSTVNDAPAARELAPVTPVPFRAGYYVLSGHYTAPLAGGGALLVPLRSDALYLSRADAHAVTHAADLPAGWTWGYSGAAEPSGALPNGGTV